MDSLKNFIADVIDPATDKLPLWLSFVSAVAIFNTIQNYITLSFTRRVYDNAPSQVTKLGARTFGVWTLTSALVRAMASRHLNETAVYKLCLWTFYIALGHFASETILFRTSNRGSLSPFVVATTSIIWMHLQADYYIGGL
ncbi:ergosterol biosynthesis protein [Savitreella phatthalungensis]